ncbi:hypothetical protein BDP27DRAFT_1385184 [Rhodocollybia butyracea]|uniref:CxC5 like cysteine cluster associated with KDZ domain-containing protein n=1 Tax=Rhodocollybia butyracea TaxID=206335 RepID=A0A9P5PF43_9AGAR|nr:hypothetical protein BDP27DRAFT_1385184 [Rhodocollybia butyracea]
MFLEMYFPSTVSFQTALAALCTLLSIYPLLALHRNQLREPRQPQHTAWKRGIAQVITDSFGMVSNFAEDGWMSQEEVQDCADSLARNDCILCPVTIGHPKSLRRREKFLEVSLLNQSLKWVTATLAVAHCKSCGADYYPDRIVFSHLERNGTRQQRLVYDAQYLRISKHGIWVHRHIAILQERAIIRFHSGWSSFAEWLSDSIKGGRKAITYRQSKRLYIEHFSRRLLIFHEKLPEIALSRWGSIPSSMHHGCTDCTHLKRFPADLVEEGFDTIPMKFTVTARHTIAKTILTNYLDSQPYLEQCCSILLPQWPPPNVDVLEPGGPRGYVRLAVMDGKSIGHRICAIDECTAPLVNFKNGRFCKDHIVHYSSICGIIPCGQPVHTPGALTCDNPSHKSWYQAYSQRFKRLTFPGVQRVMRKQKDTNGNSSIGQRSHTFQVDLPPLEGNGPDERVVHTFRAQTVYCIQTVQWSCGIPIGWGKCYRSESLPQVLSIIDHIWEQYPSFRPGFLAYDDACDLLRHIVTQDSQSPWLTSTKFIVDTWHYIGHRATDVLCRLWCNPAPTDGSQPDLVRILEDGNGVKHTTRAFNLETAEQLNAWLNGYEAQLRQMTDVMFDFHCHVLMMLYTEITTKRIEKKGKELDDDFWEEAIGS